MMNFIFNVFDSDYFPIYLIIFIVLLFAVLIGGFSFAQANFVHDTGLVSEYVHYELGPDKIRVGVVWYWLPDDLIDANVLGEQVKVWYEFNVQERVITKIEVLN
jgi:hypothetical protein